MTDPQPTVLLVDDEEENLIVLRALLDRDYEVLTAQSAEAALVLLESRKVDVLITDQRMPGLSGAQLVKEARLRYPNVVRIVLTAYTDVDVLIEAVNEGSVYGYVIKPWSVEHMRETIQQAVDWAIARRRHGELAAELQRANRELAKRNAELACVREQMVVEEKLVAVGRFAAEMAHEMANHIEIIDSIASHLGSLEQPSPGARSIEDLRRQTEQLTTLVGDIRELAQGDRLAPDMTRVAPHELLGQAVRICRTMPSLQLVELVADAADVGTWWLDRPKMTHLLTNLLRNAMQASPLGGTVRASLKAHGDELVVVVDDEGAGVHPEIRSRIFEPFFTTRRDEGTGLGLTICRWVAEMHGGTIEVGSSPSGGARFTLVVPRSAAPKAKGQTA